MGKILLHNSQIWRKDGTVYSWMVFDQGLGKVLQCGSKNAPLESIETKLDMKKQWIFPGFHDCHMHVSNTGQAIAKESFDLKVPTSISQFKKRLVDMVINKPTQTQWIIGYGWDHTCMERMPTCDDIDEVIPDLPVVLYRVCIHIAVINTKAMTIAGINSAFKDPENGAIDRFPEGHLKCGERNGVLRENGGLSAIQKFIPPLSSKEKEENILACLNRCMQQGVTSVHTCDIDHWHSFVALAKDHRLPIYCYCSPYCTDIDTANFPLKPGETYPNLTCEFVKVFIDGALGTETAALSLPYVHKNMDGTDNYGVMQMSETEFEELVDRINRLGFRLEIHVIGDRALETALNLLKKCNVSPAKRPLFVHCQIVRPELMDQMVKCGVVATIQPSFVPTDATWIHKRLPEGLLTCIYPWKTLLQHGVPCGGSSDSPVETTNPLQGIYDAIFRMTPEGFVLKKEECLTFVQAVALYTTGSAYADGVETSKGQLEPDFQADFVVLDLPLDSDGIPVDLRKNPEILRQTKVKEVWIGGVKKWAMQ